MEGFFVSLLQSWIDIFLRCINILFQKIIYKIKQMGIFLVKINFYMQIISIL